MNVNNRMLNESNKNSPQAIQKSHQYPWRSFRRSTSKETTKCDAEITKTAFLEALYKDDANTYSPITDKNTKCQMVKENFELFELETHLALADHCYNSNIIQSKIPTMIKNVEDEKFVACEKLLKEKKENCSKERDFIPSCDITESEMVQCCKNVEIMWNKNENVSDETHFQPYESPPQSTHKKSIVEAILKDFCSSPYTSPINTPPEQRYITYLERTPRFKLLQKPTRVYSRRKKETVEIELAEDNLNSIIEYESVNESSDGINSLISSPLSMQDDIQSIKDNSEIPLPNSSASQPLCDNLLNLSNYFTQNPKSIQNDVDQVQNNILADNDMFSMELAGQLLEQIVALRNQCTIAHDRNSNSCEEFLGFSSDNDSVLCLPNIGNSLDDTLIQSDIIKLSAECLLSSVSSLVYQSRDEETSLLAINRDVSAPIPDCKQNNEKEFDRVDDDDYVVKNTKHWFENDDDDDDFFATFTTQDVVLGSAKSKLEDITLKKSINTPLSKLLDQNTNGTDNFIGFRNANGIKVCINEESKKRVENLLKDFNVDDDVIELEKHLKAMKNKSLTKRQEKYADAVIKMTSGEDIKKQQEQQPQPQIITAPIDSNKSHLSECNYYSGFKTANGAVINISEQAKKTVAHILKECELKDDFDELLNLKQKIQKSHKTKCTSTIALATASTAAITTNRSTRAICNENEKNETTLSINERRQPTPRRKHSDDNIEIVLPIKSSSGNGSGSNGSNTSTNSISNNNSMKYMNKSIIRIGHKQQKQQSPKQQQRLRRLTLNGDEFVNQSKAIQNEENEQEQEVKQIIKRKNLLSLSAKNKRKMKTLALLSENKTHNNNNNNNNNNKNKNKNSARANKNEIDNEVESKISLKSAQNESDKAIKSSTVKIVELPTSSTLSSTLTSLSTTSNILAFFSQAAQTSTPFGVPDNGQHKETKPRQQQRHQDIDDMDSGLKPILWSDNNDDSTLIYSAPYSSPSCSPASSSYSDKTLAAHSQQHTLRERLLLLDIYGDAPNLSPIVLRNQQQQQQEQHYKIKRYTCGLKRPRNSLLRKT